MQVGLIPVRSETAQRRDMLEAYSRKNMRRVAYLHNAYGKEEVEILNGVGVLKFTMPLTDPKNEFLQPFEIVKSFNNQMYRIIEPSDVQTAGGGQARVYICEHCIATLADSLIPGWNQVDNLTTRQTIEYVLSRQRDPLWRLGECDFDFRFSYGWQDEHCLNALMSITEVFTEKYMWVTESDMNAPPWTLHLKRLEEAIPTFYIRANRNMLKAQRATDLKQLCTRLYLYGYGEGVNRLTVASVNGGKEYIDSPKEYVDKYGLIEKYLVDREYETAPELLAHGKKLLAALQEPRLVRTFDVAELFEITRNPLEQARIGDVARFTEDNTDNFVVRCTRNLDVQGNLKIDIANAPEDIAGAIADLADRQRIEMIYAQGATNVYAVHGQDNATTSVGMKVSIHMPSQIVNVNKVLLRYRLESFRSPVTITKGGGSTTRTSSSGGGSSQTSSSGGGGTSTSSSGGGSAPTSSSGGGGTATSASGGGGTTTAKQISVESSQPSSHFTDYSGNLSLGSQSGTTDANGNHGHTVSGASTSTTGNHSHFMPSHTHTGGTHTHQFDHTHGLAHSHTVDLPTHTHSVTFGTHTHSVTISAHTHSVDIPAHTHSVTIPSHTHDLTLPDHQHEMTQGLFRYGSPTGGTLRVRGVNVGSVGTSGDIDITQHMLSGSTVPRGVWIDVEILPNDLAYVTIDLFVQVFIQSRGGAHY